MTLTRKNGYCYGDTIDDLQAELVDYSQSNKYEAVKFFEAVCACGGRVFKLLTDEDEGVAQRICVACGTSHLMGDSQDYADDAELEGHVCVCDGEEFHLLSGVALYRDSSDVRWYYIGCHCTQCKLVGVFADWKCDGGDAESFLSNT